jgi:predicted HAD superfamily phosphohydrolase YqeG
MRRRTRLVMVPDDLSMADLIGRLGGYDVVVVDVDNTLTPDEAPGSVVAASLDEIRAAAQQGGVGRLVALSNGSPYRAVAGDGVMWAAGKPFTKMSAVGVGAGQSVAVVGDKILTDGVLAHRWRAVFYLKPLTSPSGRRPMVSRAVGWLARRLLFAAQPLE